MEHSKQRLSVSGWPSVRSLSPASHNSPRPPLPSVVHPQKSTWDIQFAPSIYTSWWSPSARRACLSLMLRSGPHKVSVLQPAGVNRGKLGVGQKMKDSLTYRQTGSPEGSFRCFDYIETAWYFPRIAWYLSQIAWYLARISWYLAGIVWYLDGTVFDIRPTLDNIAGIVWYLAGIACYGPWALGHQTLGPMYSKSLGPKVWGLKAQELMALESMPCHNTVSSLNILNKCYKKKIFTNYEYE